MYYDALRNYADAVGLPTFWDVRGVINRKNYIGPIFESKYNWFIRQPKASLRPDYYLQPFEKELWMVIIIFLIIGSGLVVFATYISKTFETENLFLVFEIFCNQSNENTDQFSLKIMFLLFNIIGLVIVSSFGAVITSFLSVEIPKIPFKDLDGFIRNGQYKLNLNLDSRARLVEAYLEACKLSIIFELYIILVSFI